MRTTFIALIFMAAISLSACEKKEDPFTKADIDHLVSLIYKNKTREIEFCARQWADQSVAKSGNLKKCEAIVVQLIHLFQKEGFKDLTTEDVEFPSLWIAFNKKAKAAADIKAGVKQLNDAFKW